MAVSLLANDLHVPSMRFDVDIGPVPRQLPWHLSNGRCFKWDGDQGVDMRRFYCLKA